jgi:hypothetical protein
MSLSAELAQKSVQAAISAIEIYNKPNFSYREEAFALLMTNAWELLLKAKWLLDYDEGKKGQTHFSGRTRKNASVPFYLLPRRASPAYSSSWPSYTSPVNSQ